MAEHYLIPEGYKDPIFKGVTRPATYWGIPIAPLLIAFFVVGFISSMTIIYTWLFMIPTLVIMRQITASNPQQWRLLGLWLLFRVYHFDRNWWHWRSSTYSPNHRRR